MNNHNQFAVFTNCPLGVEIVSLSHNFNAVATWPVTGPGFQNTTGSLVFSVNFTNRKKTAFLNYHMLITKSQAILKRFKDLNLAFGLRMFVTLITFFRSTAGQDF